MRARRAASLREVISFMRKPSRSKYTLLSAVMMMAPAALPLCAQVRLVHPEGDAKHAFEVATIKPSLHTALPWQIRDSPAHFAATNMSVNDLVRFAYGIKSDAQLVDAPSWLLTERFDIQAKASDAEIAAYDKLGIEEQMNVSRLLVQSLLEDRFQLKAKTQARDLPVYALMVANGGAKMKEVKPDSFPPPGGQPTPGAHVIRLRMTAPNQFTATAWPMGRVTDWLSRFYEVGNRPVVDETGLKGNYDWVLSGVAQRPSAPSEADRSPAQEATVSLFAALPEQLGLKLVPKTEAVEVLVIEKIEQPSAN
jgi:uncharacterized protein (TIGR03435 family)